MSSVQSLREFISERLTAAAEEIFTEFEKTIVQYEEVIDRQRKLLDITWKPQTHLHTTELPQHCVWKEDVLNDQQLYNQESNSSLDQEEPEPLQNEEDQEEPELSQIEDDQEEPEPPQNEEDQEEPEPSQIEDDQEEPAPSQIEDDQEEEICTGQDEEHLSLKQEYDIFIVTPAYEEINYKKPGPAQEEPEPPQQEELCLGQDEEQHLLVQETEGRNHWEPEKNIIQNKKELDRQRRTLKVKWKPQIQLHNMDLPRHHTLKEKEVVTGQWLYNQEMNSSSDQEEPELPQKKEEQKNLEPPQANPKPPEMKEEQGTDILMVTPVYKEINHGELEPNQYQWFSQNSSESENQVQEGNRKTDSVFSRDEELKQRKRSSQTRGHSDNVDHPKVKRNPKKCFVCSTCGRKFSEKYNLTAHMRTHTGEKPFSCQICGKTFAFRSALNSHVKSHTGEKPFNCQICGKSYSENNSFKYHMKTHTGERSFTCETCGKSFILGSALSAHMRTHTGEKPFSCETCGKSFIRKDHLKAHKKIHTGERPFSCQICGKSFIFKADLNVHIKTHTGERPFSCQICRKGFIVKGNLNSHMKTHRDYKE